VLQLSLRGTSGGRLARVIGVTVTQRRVIAVDITSGRVLALPLHTNSNNNQLTFAVRDPRNRPLKTSKHERLLADGLS